MHKKDIDGVCFSVAGISYAFQKLAAFDLENSLSPTADMVWINHIVSKKYQLNKEQALKMLNLAMKWKTVHIFKSIMESPVCTISVVNVDVLSKAWKIFSFEAVQLRFVYSPLTFLNLFLTVSKVSNKRWLDHPHFLRR
jgi:hypothetical protein